MANALPAPAAARLKKITRAFEQDGFEEIVRFPDPAAPGGTLPYCLRKGRLGVTARHNAGTARTPRYKNAFYVEGDHETMGWLLGFMAEADVARMTTEYMLGAIPDFVHPDVEESPLERELADLFLKLVGDWVNKMKGDIPAEYHAEIQGLYDGCREANPATVVTLQNLWELNIGTDAILSHVYTGELLKPVVDPRFLRVPLHCNFFAAPGDGQRRLFGRDFIFPTAGVFQDTACLVVYRPENANALVSQTAPGLIGCITGLNADGVAIGINMTASRLCDPERPGFNGLLLNRYCMERAESAKAAVTTVLDAQRGVAWVYPVADASGDSFVIEAGMRIDEGPFPYLEYVPDWYRGHLPDVSYIQDKQRQYDNPPPDRGAFVRGADYRFPVDYITDWNKGLWKAYNRNPLRRVLDLFADLGKILTMVFKGKLRKIGRPLRSMLRRFADGIPWSPGYFGARAYISARWTQRHCPGPFYFAPQRESRGNVIVATNNFISPEMRLVGMAAWTSIVARTWYDDFQWRYDELNREVLDALDAHPGGLTDEAAWSLINFLSSKGQFHEYHNPGRKLTPDMVKVHGSVSLCDLTTRRIKSLYGYYGEDPVTLTLPDYLE